MLALEPSRRHTARGRAPAATSTVQHGREPSPRLKAAGTLPTGIGGQLEGLGPVGLQAEDGPDAMHLEGYGRSPWPWSEGSNALPPSASSQVSSGWWPRSRHRRSGVVHPVRLVVELIHSSIGQTAPAADGMRTDPQLLADVSLFLNPSATASTMRARSAIACKQTSSQPSRAARRWTPEPPERLIGCCDCSGRASAGLQATFRRRPGRAVSLPPLAEILPLQLAATAASDACAAGWSQLS
jgi:hypothetical protein